MNRKHLAVMRRITSSLDCTSVTVQLYIVVASMLLGLQQLHCKSSVTEEVQHEVMIGPASQDTFPLALEYRTLLVRRSSC
jgi:hypothetical protein